MCISTCIYVNRIYVCMVVVVFLNMVNKKNIPNVKFPVFIIFKCTVLFRIYKNVYIHTIYRVLIHRTLKFGMIVLCIPLCLLCFAVIARRQRWGEAMTFLFMPVFAPLLSSPLLVKASASLGSPRPVLRPALGLPLSTRPFFSSLLYSPYVQLNTGHIL